MTPEQKRAYVLADNKLAMNAGWDEELLAEELKGLLPTSRAQMLLRPVNMDHLALDLLVFKDIEWRSRQVVPSRPSVTTRRSKGIDGSN